LKLYSIPEDEKGNDKKYPYKYENRYNDETVINSLYGLRKDKYPDKIRDL